jgi:hypothetical protein
MGIKKIPKGVVGILDDGTLMVCSDGAGEETGNGRGKVIKVGKIRAL